jgi:hypothetical protein
MTQKKRLEKLEKTKTEKRSVYWHELKILQQLQKKTNKQKHISRICYLTISKNNNKG